MPPCKESVFNNAPGEHAQPKTPVSFRHHPTMFAPASIISPTITLYFKKGLDTV